MELAWLAQASSAGWLLGLGWAWVRHTHAASCSGRMASKINKTRQWFQLRMQELEAGERRFDQEILLLTNKNGKTRYWVIALLQMRAVQVCRIENLFRAVSVKLRVQPPI